MQSWILQKYCISFYVIISTFVWFGFQYQWTLPSGVESVVSWRWESNSFFIILKFGEGGDRTCRFLYVMPWIKQISKLHQHLLEYVMKDVPHTILHIHPNNSIKAVTNCSKATQLFTNTTFCFVWSFNRTLEQHSTDNPDINVPGNK